MNIFLGIDIGGSSFKYGFGNCEVGLQYYQTLNLPEKNLTAFLSIAAEMFNDVDSQFGLNNLKGIGIGIPGAIDKITGCAMGTNPNLPFWVNHSPLELIPDNCKLPLAFDNDANLMALAEASVHCKQYAIGVTIGSGIGCGIISNGHIFHGANGYAGELGHICVANNGAKCNCGKNGCLEAYSSFEGLRNLLAIHDPLYAKIDLPSLVAKKETDSLVNEYCKRGEHLLAMALAGLATCLDPEIIILGGGAMDFDLYYISEIEKDIWELLPEAQRTKISITKAKNGNKAGVLGAIKLIEEKFCGNWE